MLIDRGPTPRNFLLINRPEFHHCLLSVRALIFDARICRVSTTSLLCGKLYTHYAIVNVLKPFGSIPLAKIKTNKKRPWISRVSVVSPEKHGYCSVLTISIGNCTLFHRHLPPLSFCYNFPRFFSFLPHILLYIFFYTVFRNRVWHAVLSERFAIFLNLRF